MTRKQLKIIRERMGLTQAELAEKLKMARNSVARMESGRMIITPPMALLISFVAREAGVDIASHGRAGGPSPADETQSRKRSRHPRGKDRKGKGSSQVSGSGR
jgi:transcriptional regulator with XRE-family HTH domain